MTDTLHPLAPHFLPRFISGADGSDPLFMLVLVSLVILLMTAGILYLKLHALPERMAHQQNNTQMQVIAVLAILALFTHNNIFWVAALLLSAIRLPDFSTPINSIADSLETLAQASARNDTAQSAKPIDDTPATVEPAQEET